MNILLLGSGGREHAIAWKLSQSDHCRQLYVAPGNGGTLQCGINLAVRPTDFQAVRQAVLSHQIDMLVVGPEDPLVAGITDFFAADTDLKNMPVIGPLQAAARLEGSKRFAKEFMQRHDIPTARFQTFSRETLSQGIAFLEQLSPPYVLKADGLAAGKGVIILDSLHQAKEELEKMLHGKFGQASRHVVIEEFLDGSELSVFVITDGIHYQYLPSAKDYKRAGEKDTGPNTGGMGALSPVAFATDELLKKVDKQIVQPTLEGLTKEGITYKGFLYFGLMNVMGEPRVVEYNCRLGDPEAQVVLPRIKNDLVELFAAVSNQSLSQTEIVMDERTTMAVILASAGYPERYETGFEITGLEQVEDCLVFHAGTRFENGRYFTSGGRVMAITAYGKSLQQAMEQCYQEVEKIKFQGKYYRTDIGQDMLHHASKMSFSS
jgi:phosphoribosylamine--glycine ligase